MTNWIQWDIDDYEAENPLGIPASFDFNISLEYDPGDPGCQYSAGGDGYPGHSGSVAIIGAECTAIVTEDGKTRPPTREENTLLEQWLLSVLDRDTKLRQQIEQCGLDQLCLEPDYVDWDD